MSRGIIVLFVVFVVTMLSGHSMASVDTLAQEAYSLYRMSLRQLLDQVSTVQTRVKPQHIQLLSSPISKSELLPYLNQNEKVCQRQLSLVNDPQSYVNLRRNPCSVAVGQSVKTRLKLVTLKGESLVSASGAEYRKETYQVGKQAPVDVLVNDGMDELIKKEEEKCRFMASFEDRQRHEYLQRCMGGVKNVAMSYQMGALSNRKFSMTFDLNQVEEIAIKYSNLQKNLKSKLGFIPRLAFVARKPKITIRVAQTDLKQLQGDIMKKKYFQIGALRFDKIEGFREASKDDDETTPAQPQWITDLYWTIYRKDIHARSYDRGLKQELMRQTTQACPQFCTNLPRTQTEGLHRIKVQRCLCLCQLKVPQWYSQPVTPFSEEQLKTCGVRKQNPIDIVMSSTQDQVLGYAEY